MFRLARSPLAGLRRVKACTDAARASARCMSGFGDDTHIYRNEAAGSLTMPTPLPNFTDFVMQDFAAHGDKVAIAVHGENYEQKRTYNDLIADTNAVAYSLQDRFNLGVDDTVYLISPNNEDYFSAVHGVVKFGGVLSPGNPLCSEKEIANQLRDSGAKVAIAHPFCLQTTIAAVQAVGKDIPIIVLGDQVPEAAAAHCAGTFNELKGNGQLVSSYQPSDPDKLCILPYSSGTTGLPKGTMLTHTNLVANVLQFVWPEIRFWRPAAETLISPLPFFHIYGFTASLNVTLWNGSTVVTMPSFDMERFLALVQDYKCTKAHLVPPIILGLAKHPLVDKYDLSSLRTVVSGAAPLGPEVEKAAWQRLEGKVTFKQAWGMSELSPIGTCNPDDNLKTGSSGPPVAGMDYKIVDTETGESLPVGKEGEVVCRGPNVMIGYLNNPEGTADCLKDGWLRTGDIGYFDEDGYITFTDRLKELIKYKGFQVPPAELEALLLTHDAVLDAAVIPRLDEEAGEVPRAFVVLKPGKEASADDIIEWAASKTAPHKKLRGGVIFQEQIPKSASGKILRRILVAQDRAGEFEH